MLEKDGRQLNDDESLTNQNQIKRVKGSMFVIFPDISELFENRLAVFNARFNDENMFNPSTSSSCLLIGCVSIVFR